MWERGESNNTQLFKIWIYVRDSEKCFLEITIQFNSLFIMCLLNSPNTNYKVSMSKTTQNKHAHEN
jgi:heptaprenylglyceryl phosphate synthase